ncbi:MAG: cytochrome P450 [Paracoccaceae bacterium]|jgi:cytochrome P450
MPRDAETCPYAAFGRAYDPFSHDGLHDLFRRARAEAPVFYSQDIGYWVLTRRDDAVIALRDAARFSADVTLAPLASYPPEMLAMLAEGGFTTEPTSSNCDRPAHTKFRALAAQYLNMRRFNAEEPRIRALARDAIAAMPKTGRVDLVSSLTYELPARVLLEMMGMHDIDPARIKRWGDNRLMMIFGRPDAEALRRGAEELLDFFLYCRKVVEARIAAPGDDYPSALLAMRGGDDGVVTLNQIVSLVFGLLLAGHETTTNALANLVLALMRDREQWEALKADPSLVPNAVEEGLRHASSVIAWRRRALEDVEFQGVTIPAGDRILIALTSANRDEAQFDDPERFDVARPNARDHIAFGNGLHFCIGAPLARLEMRVVLEELLAAYPDMALAEGQTFEYIRTIAFRGPERLEVELTGAA